jgi:hypothetical protein
MAKPTKQTECASPPALLPRLPVFFNLFPLFRALARCTCLLLPVFEANAALTWPGSWLALSSKMHSKGSGRLSAKLTSGPLQLDFNFDWFPFVVDRVPPGKPKTNLKQALKQTLAGRGQEVHPTNPIKPDNGLSVGLYTRDLVVPDTGHMGQVGVQLTWGLKAEGTEAHHVCSFAWLLSCLRYGQDVFAK